MNPHTVETAFNLPQFKVFPHLTFNFNDPKSIFFVTFLPLQDLPQFGVQIHYSQIKFKWEFYFIYCPLISDQCQLMC
jgi:hypothetical protein